MNVKLVFNKVNHMRLPEKPPSDEEIRILLTAPNVKIDELKPYMATINSEYLHWDELPMRFKSVSFDLKLLWGYACLSREFGNARPISINGLTLRYFQTPQIEKMLHDLDVRVGGKISLGSQIPGPELQKKYLVNSLMEEAIASSQLEGAVTSRPVAKKMLRENRKPRNPSERMILNNYLTMKYIREHTGQKQLSIGFLKEIHKRITSGTLENSQYEGMFRTDNEIRVFTKDEGQLIHVPPDYNDIDKLLGGVCNFANSEHVDYYLHPFVKAIVIHYMLGYIHPFVDGNGRTARALFYWYLIAQGYDYLEYVAISTAIKNAPAQYTRAYLYAESDHNDVTYFVKFNLRQFELAVTSFEKYIEKTKAENKIIFETIRQNQKMNFRQADILISMSKDESPITIFGMYERYATTYQTARTDLFDLVKQGYLHPVMQGKQYFFVLDKDKCLKESN